MGLFSNAMAQIKSNSGWAKVGATVGASALLGGGMGYLNNSNRSTGAQIGGSLMGALQGAAFGAAGAAAYRYGGAALRGASFGADRKVGRAMGAYRLVSNAAKRDFKKASGFFSGKGSKASNTLKSNGPVAPVAQRRTEGLDPKMAEAAVAARRQAMANKNIANDQEDWIAAKEAPIQSAKRTYLHQYGPVQNILRK